MKFLSLSSLVLGLLLCLFFSCSTNSTSKKGQTLFQSLPSSQTGIDFANQLTENDSLNYFTYAYIYMGGGQEILIMMD